MSGYGYGTLPAHSGIKPIATKWPATTINYSENFGLVLTNSDGVVDPLYSLTLTSWPSGAGELVLSGLSVDPTGLLVSWIASGGVPGRIYYINIEWVTASMVAAGLSDQRVLSQCCAPELAVYPLPPEPSPGPGTPVTWAANGTLTAYGNLLALSTQGMWPTSSAGLPPGALYSASTPGAAYIYAVTGFGSVPGPPVFLNAITGAALLALNASVFPQADPHVVNQIYLNGNLLCVSFG